MKLKLLLLKAVFILVGLFLIQPVIWAQGISIKESSTTLIKLFEEIEKQSDYLFSYVDSDVKDIRVKIDIQQTNVEKILNQALSGTSLTYEIVGRNITIGKQKLKEKILDNQPIVVKGVITDEKDTPMMGVNIVAKGTRVGVTTDIDGKYSITLPDKNMILVYSFIGYANQEIIPLNRDQINISLKVDNNILDELVVLGYGSMKRKEVTGSVASIKTKDLPEIGGSSIAQFLNGRAAGLTTTIASAQPGGAVNMQIRGSATGRSPLIVVDGFPISSFTNAVVGVYRGGETDAVLSSLNPNDIESIDILKDASATSIYGSKAAGGVILVTTKRGKSEKTVVEFSGNMGWAKVYGLPELLNPYDFMIEKNRESKEKFMYDNQIFPYGNNTWGDFNNFKPTYRDIDLEMWKNKAGTNWVDEVSRTAMVRNFGLNIQGGGTTTKYFTSFGYYSQEGIVKNNNIEKYTGQINIDQKLGKKINLGISLSLNRTYIDNVPLQSGYAEETDILRAALLSPPNLSVRDSQGKYSTNPFAPYMPNPVSLLDITNKTKNDRVIANTSLSYELLPGLLVRGTLGTDIMMSQGMGYLPTTTLMGQRVNGRADRRLDEKNDYQAQLFLTYNKTIGQYHSIGLTTGTEFISTSLEGYRSTNTNFISDGFLWNNLAMGAGLPDVGSYATKSQTLAYVSRINYVFAERYFITANARIDGSSNFAANHQWGFFPGVSVGWDIAKESFMGNINQTLNQFKIRLGYGQTGNDNIGSAFANYYYPGDKTLFGNSINSTMYLGSLGNPNLKWETQTDLNLGVDFTLFNGRINGSIEYFNRVISDILGWKSLSSNNEVTGFSANLDSKKQTYGYELTFNTNNVDIKNFKWNTNLTFTYYRDRWLKRDESWKPDINNVEKQYFGELWFHQTDGLIQPGETVPYTSKPIPGTIKLRDVDGYLKDANGAIVLDENKIPMRSGEPDGKIDNADLVKVGVNTPFTIGINNSFTVKQFDLNIFVYGMFNRWKNNSTRQLLTDSYWMKDGLNQSIEVKNRWNSDNTMGVIPSSLQGLSGLGSGDFYLEDAWFIRVSNISLGYTIPMNKTFNKLRVFFAFQNPFLITPYKGMDPETDSREAAYPNQRSIQFGLNIKF